MKQVLQYFGFWCLLLLLFCLFVLNVPNKLTMKKNGFNSTRGTIK